MSSELAVGQRLRKERLRRRLSLRDVGVLNYSTLSRIETTGKARSVDLVVLSRFYGVSVDWMLGLSKKKRRER